MKNELHGKDASTYDADNFMADVWEWEAREREQKELESKMGVKTIDIFDEYEEYYDHDDDF